ncbi:MAG: S8 family peptidase [Bacteroidota bacterium]
MKRAKKERFNPLPAFLLILVAIGFQMVYPAANMFERVGHLLLDFGVGMTLASVYLALRRAQAKLFWVPGLLATFLGGGVYLLSMAYNGLTASTSKEDPATVQLLVELGADDELSEIEGILKKYDAVAEKAFPQVDMSESVDLAQYYVVYVDSAQRDLLSAELRSDVENVDQLAPNRPVKLEEPIAGELKTPPGQFIANDPQLNGQWYAKAIEYNQVFEFLQHHKPAKKIKVAVVDTGVDKDHEDLNSTYEESGGDGDYDKHSHGTHCAGLVGAITNNGIGVGSLNWEGRHIALSGYPALDDNGRGTDRRVAKAIIDAAEGGADVISMSLGGFSPFPPKAQKDAIKYAVKLGATVIVAAGNSNDDARRYSPANIPGVIVVSAVDENLNKASFSNTNTKLKQPIAAPGVNILSTVPGSKYVPYSGTSMATPIVAGLVGIMKSYKPGLTNKEIYNILHKSGMDVRDTPKVGRVINPLKALELTLKK